MRAIAAIAAVTIREALRQKLAVNLLVFALALLSATLTISALTFGEQYRIIVDLGLRIADVSVVRYDTALDAIRAGTLADGQLVYHDRAGDAAAAAAWTAVEAGGPVRLGAVTLVPVASDPVAGWWLLRVVAGS